MHEMKDSLELYAHDDMHTTIYHPVMPSLGERVVLPINELLANRLYDRKLDALVLNVFRSWRNFVFALYYTREDLIVHHLLRTLTAKFFYGWRWISRVQQACGRPMRRHWRRKKRHAFQLWKWGARFQSRKLMLCDEAFTLIYRHVQYQENIAAKWKYLFLGLAARRIQRAFIRSRYRNIYWGMKTIKYFITRRMCHRLLKVRRRHEHKRKLAEAETVSILLRRASTCYENFVSSENPKLQHMIQTYYASLMHVLREIEDLPASSIAKTKKIFPTSADVAEISRMWTSKSKAMCVVSHRVSEIASLFAKKRFRRTYPPQYECYRCAETFFFRKECYDHCKYRCKALAAIDWKRPQTRDGTLSKIPELQLLDCGVLNSNPHRSRTYSRHLTPNTKYSYQGVKPDYYCATLAHPLVEKILSPLHQYLTVND